MLLVRTHLAHGESRAALEVARSVLADEPENAEIRSLVGGALLASGDIAGAREMLVPAVAELLDKSEHKKAQAALKDLLREMPEDQEVLQLAVRAYRPSGDDETLFTLEAALAESYFQSGEHQGAKRLFIKLLEREPENRQFRQRLAELDGVDIGRTEEEAVVEVSADEEVDEIAIEFEEQEIVVEGAPIVEEVEFKRVEAEPPPAAGRISAPDGFDLGERLAEASVFAKYGLVEKAISHLEDVVLFCPDELEPRQRLALLYAEHGDRDEAIAMAAPVVEHHRGRGTMEQLGTLLAAIPELADHAGSAPSAEPVAAGFFDEGSDLIEIVEIEGDTAVPPTFDEPAPEVEEYQVDYASGVEILGEQPAPSEVAELTFEDAPPVEQVPEILEAPPPVAHVEPIPSSPPPPVVEEVAEELVEISDSFVGPSMGDLEQIDFFIEQELFEDASRVLAQLEQEHGGDPEVAERRRKLKEIGVLLEQVETVEEGSEELFADEEQYIDLAKELEAELAAEEAMVEEATGRGKGEAILEEVFREFQRGVAEQLSEEDADTHFNLGIAYREMGLLPEAIREFQVASRDTSFFVESCSNIGVCYQEQGMWTEAVEWYQKALVAPDISADARVGLRYDLASAYQSAGDVNQAADIFEEIAATNPSYRDVSDRLSNLSQQRQAN